MGKKKETEDNLTIEPQSEEAREKVLHQATGGLGTATGQAKANLLGHEDERLEGLASRGSEVPIAGGDQIKADYPEHEGAKPIGNQAVPAAFTTNGSLPLNMVPSPSGPVPASTVAGDQAAAAQAVRRANKERDDLILRSGAKKLSREQIEGMNAADLRAVAHDRGYDLGDYAGSRVTRRRFIEAQGKDSITEGGEAATGDGQGGEAGERVE